MADSFETKNGLVYSKDLKTILGVDTRTPEFTGKIPYGARFIEDEVFTECPYSEVSIPDSVEAIGVCLFRGSTNLKTVKLPVYLGDIPPYLFDGCTALEKVTMPTTVAAFSDGMFKDCKSMAEIPFRAGIKELPEDVLNGCSGLTSLVIPNTVERICTKAVANCTGLTALVLPAALRELADDAFENTNNISNIRISIDNEKFFVGEDGCLYERTAEGDKLRLSVAGVENQGVSFFKENPDDLQVDFELEDEEESDDDMFSAEIGAAEEEAELWGSAVSSDEVPCENIIKTEEIPQENAIEEFEESKMSDSNVDEMLADIMGEERARSEVSADVAVGEKESQVLSEMMDVMNDKPANNTGAVTAEELANLFSNNEKDETVTDNIVDPETDSTVDSKTQILIDSVGFSKIIECDNPGDPLVDPDLFVIAEKTITDSEGNKAFSSKLEACVSRFAHVQDLKRVILLSELPVDNDEFMQFFYHFISHKNVILACQAPSPSMLSEYAKTICEHSRISLEKEELLAQRKKISIKNDTLIKLVIQDKYEA